MELISGSYKALEEDFLKYFTEIKKDPLDKVLIITQSKRLAQSLKEKLLSSNECLSCVFWQDMLGLVYAVNQTSENYIPLRQKTALDYFKLKDFLKKSDFSIPIGLSYEFDDAVVELRYNIGLSNIKNDNYIENIFYNGNKIDSKVHNSVLMLTFGYRIPM